MSIIGKVDSLWRYPVKSMRGEELDEVFVGYSGIYGDRIYAFRSSASHKGFPYLTAREQRKILKYRPRFRKPDKAARPINLTEAESLGPGLTPLFADLADLMVDVETPTGETMAIDDPALVRSLSEGLRDQPEVALIRSERALTDCRPVSIFSVQTAKQLGEESGASVDKRRFRANIYLDFETANGFTEDRFVGRSLRLGSRLVVSILERDARCTMITFDPDTGESSPELLKKIAQGHQGAAGVYGAVMIEGTVRKGDAVELLD